MLKQKWIVLFFAIIVTLVGCSSSTEDDGAESSNSNSDEAAEVSETDEEQHVDFDSLIGKELDFSKDEVTLPFESEIVKIHFSEDNRVQLVHTLDVILLVKENKIVHAEKGEHIIGAAVSSDGKMAAWRPNKDGRGHNFHQYNIYDFEKEELSVILEFE